MASIEEHRETLKTRPNKNRIGKAIQHERNLQFHTEAFLSANDISQPATLFLDWVKGLLPKDKYAVFVSLFKFPTPIIELTSKIYEQLERVFDGKNPAEHYRFVDSSYAEDWDEYRTKQTGQPDVWRFEAWEIMKTAINSVLIVDLPVEQTTDLPEPYFYFLDIDKVLDYTLDGDKITSIIFEQDQENRLAVIDDEFYRVVRIDKKLDIVEVEVENPHGLGYCPAQFFWTDNLVFKQKDLKRNPLSPQLSNLDWLLFYAISKKHLDLYAPYPIYSGYENDCDFENVENGDYCDGGFLRGADDNYKVLRNGTIEQCPKCAEKALAGVGSFIEVKAPKTKEDPDLRNPIQITTIDRDSLDYNVEEVGRLAKQIEDSVVGAGSTAQETQAINKDQVSANYSLKTNILNNLKVNFENAMKFVNDTMCRLRYQSAFIGSYKSLGTEFYIHTTADLYALFKEAKANGANEAELDAITDEIIATQYRNDPQMMQRMLILRNLEPYRHHTKKELLEIQDKQLLNRLHLVVKLNFTPYIDRFERENINILEFGSQISFDQKIKIIFESLLEYAREELRVEATTPEGGPILDPNGDVIETPVDVEAEAKARLKGSVGGVQGILEIQKSYSEGVTSREAALAILEEIFGFDGTTGARILGQVRQN